jgi:hypothetical protein
MNPKIHSLDDEFFDKVRDCIAAGRLPAHRDVDKVTGRTNAGMGSVRGLPITSDVPHLVIRWKDISESVLGAVLHPDCHAIWLVAARNHHNKRFGDR